MPKLTIDDIDIEVAPGTNILQAAEELGIEIPRFCYHDKLSVAGNCRMCLVEIEGLPPKPVASCCMACGEGMVVHTDTPMVKKARRGVMEFMLANHPLDCPLCDQGGECDLQDQALAYGGHCSRFHENKRAVESENFGPLIATNMTRCINCTRCVRFLDEIAGTPVLGQLNRGEDSKIGTYTFENITSELSGNLIDICPVGALTSKPYRFKARRWELKKTESIDIHDSLGCNIRIDSRGDEVMRIVPRLNEEINECWIDDRARFSCDGLVHQRLDTHYVRDPKTNKHIEITWEEAFSIIKDKFAEVNAQEIAAIAGNMADVESMVALKDLMVGLGSPHMDCRTDGTQMTNENRSSYLFNSRISGVDEADAIVLIGTNPRKEATLLNARIRRNWLERGVRVYVIGDKSIELTYPYEHLGATPKDLEKLKDVLASTKKPMMIIGSDIFMRNDALALHALLGQYAEDIGIVRKGWNGFNILHKAASRVGGLDIGFVPKGNEAKRFDEIVAGTKDGSIKALIMLGADEFNARVNLSWQTFVVYIGSHADYGAARADIILPALAYTEKDGLYVNTEGRPQLAKRAVAPLKDAKEDWTILRALSEHLLREALPYNTWGELYKRICKEWPLFKSLYQITPSKWAGFTHKGGVFVEEAFLLSSSNYYLNDPICRASPTMKKCVEDFGDVGIPHEKKKDAA